MNNVDINFNKLVDLVEQKDEHEKEDFIKNERLVTEKKLVDFGKEEFKRGKNESSESRDLKSLMPFYEKSLNDNEKKYLWRMFLTYSSDNVRVKKFENN